MNVVLRDVLRRRSPSTLFVDVYVVDWSTGRLVDPRRGCRRDSPTAATHGQRHEVVSHTPCSQPNLHELRIASENATPVAVKFAGDPRTARLGEFVYAYGRVIGGELRVISLGTRCLEQPADDAIAIASLRAKTHGPFSDLVNHYRWMRSVAKDVVGDPTPDLQVPLGRY